MAGDKAEEASCNSEGFIFQCGSGSAEEGEEEKAPDEAACFSGNDGKASGEV